MGMLESRSIKARVSSGIAAVVATAALQFLLLHIGSNFVLWAIWPLPLIILGVVCVAILPAPVSGGWRFMLISFLSTVTLTTSFVVFRAYASCFIQ
ncbi:MAG: hypothetical protein QM813_06405 [Verrucomicrobiota bacterium]